MDDLLAKASIAYTAGSQRQVITLASWLLDSYRTEEELCEQLHYVLDEIYPSRRKAMLEKALGKLKTPAAKSFMACRRDARKKKRQAEATRKLKAACRKKTTRASR